MAGDGIVVEGVTEFEATSSAAAAALSDLEIPSREAGQAALQAATPNVPELSGALRSSGRVDAGSAGTAVVWDEVYAGVIFNGWPARNIVGQPWVDETETTEVVADVFLEYVEAAVHRIRGV